MKAVAEARKIIVPMLLVLSCTVAFPAGRTSRMEARSPAMGKRDVGVIFNTDDILLDLEGYQGGLGAKIGLNKSMLRVMADILLNTELDPFSLTIGAVLEKHVLPGPVSVYWGPSARMGFTTLFLDKTDADNWSQLLTWEVLSAGIVGGIELFLFDFLSVFVEYNLALTLNMNFNRVSTARSVNTTAELAYNLDLGLGNSTMFGIVVYFIRKKR
jgi:hypothetical protein